MTGQLRVVAYGGGVQSNANLVLAATGRIDYRTFLFANVGDDSEDAGTLAYIREIATPYAAATGMDLRELRRVRRDKRVETLYGEVIRDGSRRLLIPVRMSNGAPNTRSCTADFKIKVIGRELRRDGAAPTNPAVVAMGISRDEAHRVNARRAQPYEILAYPLIGMIDGRACPFPVGFDYPLSRSDCQRVITAEPLPGGPRGDLGRRLAEITGTKPACGWAEPHPPHETGCDGSPCWNPREHPEHGPCLGAFTPVTVTTLVQSGFTRMPLPGKSACWFCPFHRPSTWIDMRRDQPDTFRRACELEQTVTDRRAGWSKDPVFLTRYGIPLDQAIPQQAADQGLLGDDDSSCDNGWCMT